MNAAKILIVEAQNATAKKIEKDLINMGYMVTSIATSGDEAIKKAKEDKPDPGVDGYCAKRQNGRH